MKINELNSTNGIDIPISNSDGLAGKINISDLLSLDISEAKFNEIKNILGLNNIVNYSNAVVYSIGDSTFYNNKLYRCIKPKSTGAWSDEYFEQYDVWVDFNKIAHLIIENYNPTKTYNFGDHLFSKIPFKRGKKISKITGHTAIWNLLNKNPLCKNDHIGYYSFGTKCNNGIVTKNDDLSELKINTVKGNSVVWNQLIYNGNFNDGATGWTPYYGTLTTNNNEGVYTVNTPNIGKTLAIGNDSISDHYYYISTNIKYNNNVPTGTGSNGVAFGYGGAYIYVNGNTFAVGEYKRISGIVKATSINNLSFYLRTQNFQVGDTVDIKNSFAIDLTKMFGAGNEPTIEQFKQWFPEDYYAYDEGTIVNMTAEGVRTTSADGSQTSERKWTDTMKKCFPDGMAKAGTAYDEMGATKAVKRIGKMEFDGTENWQVGGSSENTYRFQLNGVISGSGIAGVCNAVKWIKSGVSADEELIGLYSDTLYLRLNKAKVDYTSQSIRSYIAGLKAAGTPLTVYYELAEPIVTTYDELNLTLPLNSSGQTIINYNNDSALICLDVTNPETLETSTIIGDIPHYLSQSNGITYFTDSFTLNDDYLIRVDVKGNCTLVTNDTSIEHSELQWKTLYLTTKNPLWIKLLGEDFIFTNFCIYNLTKLNCTKELFLTRYTEDFKYNPGEFKFLDVEKYFKLPLEYYRAWNKLLDVMRSKEIGIPKFLESPTFFNGIILRLDGLEVNYWVVDLGSMSFSKEAFSNYHVFVIKIPSIKDNNNNMICLKYTTKSTFVSGDKIVSNISWRSTGEVTFRDSDFEDKTAAEFKTAMQGQYLVYQLAEPIIIPFDTEEIKMTFDYSFLPISDFIEFEDDDTLFEDTLVRATKNIDSQFKINSDWNLYTIDNIGVSLLYNDILRGEQIQGCTILQNDSLNSVPATFTLQTDELNIIIESPIELRSVGNICDTIDEKCTIQRTGIRNAVEEDLILSNVITNLKEDLSNLATAKTVYLLDVPITYDYKLNFQIDSKYLSNSDNSVRKETKLKTNIDVPIGIILSKSKPIVKELSWEQPLDFEKTTNEFTQDYVEKLHGNSECLIATDSSGRKFIKTTPRALQFKNIDAVSIYGQTEGCANQFNGFKHFTSEIPNITFKSNTIKQNGFANSNILKLNCDTITNIESGAFTGCNDLHILSLPNVTTLNSGTFTQYKLKKLYFLNLQTINASALSSIRPLYIVLDLDNIPTLNASGNTSNYFYTIYVRDSKLDLYATDTNWKTIYDLGRIKPISEWYRDYSEDVYELGRNIKIDEYNISGYKLNIIPKGIKAPLTFKTLYPSKWNNTQLISRFNHVVVDNTASELKVSAECVFDKFISDYKILKIVDDEIFINTLKLKYPNLESEIEECRDLLIENPNAVNILGILSTITINQTGEISEPDKMITGSIGIKGTPENNVIAWIRENSHSYIGTEIDGVLLIKQLSDADRTKYQSGTKAPIDIIGNDVYMKLPRFYYKCVESSSDIWDITFSITKSGDGWIEWDGNHFIGAYEAYHENEKMYSVSNKKASTETSWTLFKTYANARGNNYSMVTWESHSIMGILFYAYYGNTNVQAICGSGTSSYPKTTGEKDYIGMKDSNLIYNNLEGINFWGLENWWGDLYEIMDNLRTDSPETIDGVQYRKFSIYEPSNLTTFSNRPVKYSYLSLCSGKEISKINFSKGELTPIAGVDNGSYNTYYSDYGYVEAGSGYVGYRSCYGSVAHGGVAYLNAAYGVGNAIANIGSRLEYYGDYRLI